ncbi:RCC1 domain-containing protein [Variovorax terrae]|uniref:PKD domain-containing protein n=1 Tax=Variovorax terrae TaxID=2923278 RepID=A0A9X1VXL0_9BURK|nr:RCC1 domain-containing protein [Variovorax terrae]MCJ0762398.1 hypothetical protein [Variovorax terrae]
MTAPHFWRFALPFALVSSLAACGGGGGGGAGGVAAPDAITTPLSVALTAPARVVANRSYTYSATVSGGTASQFNWQWNDGSANGSTNPAPKVWYRPGSFTASLAATTSGAAGTASQVVTVATPLASGLSTNCALKNDGTVACWGLNGFGQVGDGTQTNRTTPTVVLGLSDVISVAGTIGVHACALKADRTLNCWGGNSAGQLGDGTTVDRSIPVQVTGLSGVAAAAPGANHTCAVKTDGTVSCWGANVDGQLGDGTNTSHFTAAGIAGLAGVVQLVSGWSHSCALKADGGVSCWGKNGSGQLGDGTATSRNTPTAVAGLSRVIALGAGSDHTCALKSDGTVSCWGANGNGQIGDGTASPRSAPTAVSGLSGAVALSSGLNHNCVVKGDGGLSCWGSNGAGQLGDNTAVDRSLPITVIDLIAAKWMNVAAVSAGGNQTCSLSTDGKVSCWGLNTNGQLGNGTVIGQDAPMNTTSVSGGAIFWK